MLIKQDSMPSCIPGPDSISDSHLEQAGLLPSECFMWSEHWHWFHRPSRPAEAQSATQLRSAVTLDDGRWHAMQVHDVEPVSPHALAPAAIGKFTQTASSECVSI